MSPSCSCYLYLPPFAIIDYSTMFYMVRFLGDNILYICHEKCITQKKNKIFAKYKNGSRYEAVILLTHDSKHYLEERIKNYKLNWTAGSGSVSEQENELTRDSLNECTLQEVSIESNISTVHEEFLDDSYADPNYICDSKQNKITSNEHIILDDILSSKSSNNCSLDSEDRDPESIQSNISVGHKTVTNIHMEKIISEYSPPKNNSEVVIEQILTSKFGPKKYFCFYCKKSFSKLAKHLERIHKDESEVRNFSILPKGSAERKTIIEKIRKKGSFLFNTNKEFNNGQLLVSRRPTFSNKKVDDYKMCPGCKGLYSKHTIRKHYVRCIPGHKKGSRFISSYGKQVYGQVHYKACDILRNNVFPVLRDDLITKIIRYDELIILFGNTLCKKYRSPHHYKMIRSRLRILGRLLLEVKKLDKSISDLSSLFIPQRYDLAVSATNMVAKLNSETNEYGSPATAFEIGSLLKKCGRVYITECIKQQKHDRKMEIKDFLKVIEQEFTIGVNKTVTENQLKKKRRKKEILPSENDIRLLYKYVVDNTNIFKNKLLKRFHYGTWKKLAEFSLVQVQIFNRRRAGEVERMYIEEFNTQESITSEHPDLLKHLSDIEKNMAKKYVRFTIRGKLARGVPVLLDINLLECLQLIIKNRCEAGVAVKNPYVFGLPSGSSTYIHLNACRLLAKFSVECGASNPKLLRGTKLRKEIATRSIFLGLEKNVVSDLANFMGHNEKIHHDHYRLPIISREIGRISNILEMGVGKNKHSLTETELESLSNQENESKSSSRYTNDKVFIQEQSMYDSWSDTDRSLTLFGRSRCVSPGNNGTRRSWTEEETFVAAKHFKENIKNKVVPLTKDCCSVIQTNDVLRDRTPNQLKSWVCNQFKKGSVKLRVNWTPKEVKILRKEFKRNLDAGILPGLKLCADVCKQYSELRMRNDVTVKAWLNNEINRIKRRRNMHF